MNYFDSAINYLDKSFDLCSQAAKNIKLAKSAIERQERIANNNGDTYAAEICYDYKKMLDKLAKQVSAMAEDVSTTGMSLDMDSRDAR